MHRTVLSFFLSALCGACVTPPAPVSRSLASRLSDSPPSSMRATTASGANPSNCVISATAGSQHTCALLADHTVACWGDNGYGQLGVGDRDNRGGTPERIVRVRLDEPATSVVAGAFHTCATLVNGAVQCWGANSHGQLGVEATATASMRLSPSEPLRIARRTLRLAAGEGHTCALLEDGAVTCWGDNSVGQLGDAPTPRLPFHEIGLGRSARSLAAGSQHTCALLSGNSVTCWGRHDEGQIAVVNDATLIAAGGTTSCTVVERGQLACWGARAVSPDAGGAAVGNVPLDVAVGGGHTCVRLPDGRVKCWGENDEGQLGSGSTEPLLDGGARIDALPPLEFGDGIRALSVVAGDAHTCAVFDDGTLRCWGFNRFGQLGIGSRQNRGNKPGQMGSSLTPVNFGGACVR